MSNCAGGTETLELAAAGDVTPEVAAALRVVQQFEERRERLFRSLIGFGVRASPVRTAMLRHLLLALARDRRLSVAECHRLCRDHGSRSTVRAQIDLLVAARLVVLSKADSRRDVLVLPTKRLTAFYCKYVPMLMQDAALLYGELNVNPAGVKPPSNAT